MGRRSPQKLSRKSLPLAKGTTVPVDTSEEEPRKERLSAILQGSFLGDEAVVVTEGNGRTVRHANKAFAALTKYPLESLPGTELPDLVQGIGTDRGVLAGLRAAVRRRLPATAILLNYNRAGEQFV